MTNHIRGPAELVAVLTAEADDIASPQELLDRARAAGPRTGSSGTRRRPWLAPVAGMASVLLVVAVALTVRVPAQHHSGPATATTNVVTATTKHVTFMGVQLTIPATWPVIDGAHAGYTCSSAFLGQSDRVFLGVSYRVAPSCAGPPSRVTPPPADGVWMQPGGSTPPQQASTTLTGGQQVYLSTETASAVGLWYHDVLIQIGIGPDPAIERMILDSITYRATSATSSVLGRCPTPVPSPPPLPAPTRVITPLVLQDSNGQLEPEPGTIQPKVSAATVWDSFLQGSGWNVSGALEWSVVFGSYSAQTPAHIKPDNSTTPFYTNVPTWLIEGKGIQTDYGSCGVTVLAPYNADTGQSMGMLTIG